MQARLSRNYARTSFLMSAKMGRRKARHALRTPSVQRGLCEINFVRGPDATFEAEVTLIIDDNVSKFDGTEEISDVKAATVLLEIKDKGETHLLAQTYQNLKGHNFKALTDALKGSFSC